MQHSNNPAEIKLIAGQLMAVDFDYISAFGGKPDERTVPTEKRDRAWAEFLNIPVRKAMLEVKEAQGNQMAREH